ncbi:MAG: CHAT domain-containing protein [Pyrinomonadaceae bacterium]
MKLAIVYTNVCRTSLGLVILGMLACAFHVHNWGNTSAQNLAPDKRHDAAANFAAAEKLRNEQREDSNRAAVAKYRQAADMWRSAGQTTEASRALKTAGDIYQILGDEKNATVSYQESLALSRKSKSPAEEARTLNALAYLQFLSGDTSDARRNSTLAYKLARKINDRGIVARSMSNLAETEFTAGNLKQAQLKQQQALRLTEEVGDAVGQTQALIALGYYYGDLSEPLKALQSYNDALKVADASGDLRLETLALIAIGNLKWKLGDNQEALNYYGRARAVAQRIGDRTSLAICTGGIGVVYFGLADQPKALQYSEQALQLFEANDQKWGAAEARMDLGRINHALGRYEVALRFFSDAVDSFKRLSMPRLEAQALRDIGQVYSALHDQQHALESYKQALRLTRSGQDQRHEAYTLNCIGRTYEQLNDAHRALDYYRRALPLSRVGADHGGEALTLYNLARIERDHGNLAEAQGTIEQAIEISESLRTSVSSQDLRAAYFASIRSIYELYIDVLMLQHKLNPDADFDGRAFAVSERSRARSLLDSLQEAQAHVDADVAPELLQQERTLRALINAKAERQIQLLALKKKSEADAIGKDLDQLMIQHGEIVNRIKATSPHFAALTMPHIVEVKDVQQTLLDPNTLLLEYALGDERSYVWIVSHESIASYVLPGRHEIESSARRLYELITRYQPRPGETVEQRSQRQSAASSIIPFETNLLSKLILWPIANELGTKRLLIVTDGALQYIPFQSLVLPNDGSQPQWLMTDHEIVNEPSASTLALLLTQTVARPRGTNTVAVLADPVFEVDDPRLHNTQAQPQSTEDIAARQALRDIGISADGLQIPRLLASREEADAIMAVAPWGTGLKAVGFDASRAKVINGDLSSYRVIHIATHGVINTEHPQLSGVVFSLFDRQGQPQDGFLRLHDIYNLHLPADLVVLSACSTGLGKEIKGEGFVGLTRGFMHAGASGVVASLWKVDDDATAELMKYFYEAMFKDGLPAAAALRQAQMWMSHQKRWQAPYFWAGFILQGEYDQNESVNRYASFRGKPAVTYAATVAVGIVLVVIVIQWQRRRRNT